MARKQPHYFFFFFNLKLISFQTGKNIKSEIAKKTLNLNAIM